MWPHERNRLLAQSNGWLWVSPSVFVRLWQNLSETAISGFYQQALPSIHNSIPVWQLYMGWIPRWDSLWMAFPSLSALHFVPVFLPVSILFPLLRSTKASTHWSSFFLSFMWSVDGILGILNFWANIYLSASTYYVYSFVTGLSHDDIFKFHLYAWEFHEVIVFNSCVVFHCVNILHFVYPFLWWGTSGLFPASDYCK